MAKSVREWLDMTASVVTIAVGLLFVWLMVRPAPSLKSGIKLPSSPVPLTSDTTRGTTSAAVVVVQYADFECPFSASTSQHILPQLFREYVDSGKVQWVFKNLPLPQHKLAFGAAVAAECAARQNKFWQMHDALFADPKKLSPERLAETATSLGLDSKRFQACIRDQDGAAEQAVRNDVLSARQMGVTNTPTLIVGTRTADGQIRLVDYVEGSAPIDFIRETLDNAITGRSGSYVLLYAAGGAALLVGTLVIWYRGRQRAAPIPTAFND